MAAFLPALLIGPFCLRRISQAECASATDLGRGTSQFFSLATCVLLLWSGTAQAEVRPLNIPSAEPVHGFGLRDILPGIRFHQPIAIVNQPGADTALFVAERSGRIYVVPNL